MAVEIPPQILEYVKKTDDFMAKYPSLTQYEKLKEVEEKTGYSKVYFFIAGLTLLSIIIFLVGGLKLISDLTIFVYPAYQSFKAIDSSSSSSSTSSSSSDNNNNSKEFQITQWLTYWIVFAFFSTLEQVMSFIVGFIPFYYLIKIGLFIWLYHPKFYGASLVYNKAIRPFVLPYMEKLSKSITSAAAAATTEKKAE